MLRRARTKAGADPNSSMTPLSRSRASRRFIPSAGGLARRSLLGFLVALPSTGCVDSPPTYTAPETSPPIVLGNLVVPSPVSVITVPLNDTKHLTVPFRSLDGQLGNSLVAVYWHDLEPGLTQEELNTRFIVPISIPEDLGPLDQQQRVASFTWTASPAGCHTVTMELSHEANFPTDREKGIFEPGHLPPKDQNDIAQVTWFFDVQDKTNPSSTQTCWGTQ